MRAPRQPLRLVLPQKRSYQSRLNREQSPLKMMAVPIASVLLGSMATTLLPMIESEPLLPPLGFMMLIAWRMMRPGMWPAWIGLPFGLFDDLFSGQPFACAGLLWSVTMLAMEVIDTRVFWRDFWQNWAIGAVLITAYLLLCLLIVGLAHTPPAPTVLIPQIALSILLFPVIVRLCSWLDGLRLAS